MYATHDGNAYKNTGSGWQQAGSGGWNNAAKPSEFNNDEAARSASSLGRLEPQLVARRWRWKLRRRQRRGRLGPKRWRWLRRWQLWRRWWWRWWRRRWMGPRRRRVPPLGHHRLERGAELLHFVRGADRDAGIVGPGRPRPADEHVALRHRSGELTGRTLRIQHEAVAHRRMEAVVVLVRKANVSSRACLV